MKDFIETLEKGEDLSADTMEEAVSLMMTGKAQSDHIQQFLKALYHKGETSDEITGAARVMRDKALSIDAPLDAVDCCGTGGDKKGTYNISTAVALVAAACGVPVAKHGNRSASSKSGAADILETMGVNLNIPKPALEEALEDFRFCFLMAPNHHSAMRYVVPARKAIGHRTIFNLLGPLSNPAGARRQLIGVFDKKWLVPMAEVLRNLGSESAWIVHGRDGLDEISISGPTDCAMLDEDGKITEKTLKPEDFGLPVHDLNDIIGGSPEDNAKALRALLEGAEGAYRDIVLANAAAVLVIAEKVKTLPDGVARAAEMIDNGAAMDLLTDYVQFTRGIDDAL